MAFRAADGERSFDRCRDHAERALAGYLEAGSLTGAESVHRLLGLLHRRRVGDGTQPSGADARQAALKHFLVAHRIAETLRELDHEAEARAHGIVTEDLRAPPG